MFVATPLDKQSIISERSSATSRIGEQRWAGGVTHNHTNTIVIIRISWGTIDEIVDMNFTNYRATRTQFRIKSAINRRDLLAVLCNRKKRIEVQYTVTVFRS